MASTPALDEARPVAVAGPPAAGIEHRSVSVLLVAAVLAVVSVVCAGAATGAVGKQSRAADRAASAAALSDAYQDALYAATVDQSLERAYLLGEQQSVLVWQRQASASVDEALEVVARLGGAADRAAVQELLGLQADRRSALPLVLTPDGQDLSAGAWASALSEDVQDLLSERAQAAHRVAVTARTASLRPVAPVGLLVGGAAGAALLATCLVALLALGHRRALRSAWSTARHLQAHDSLTGLPNRAVLHDRLEQSLLTARRSGGAVALLVIDLDRFKDINDALGHDYGDRLLAQLGPCLRAPLRESDTVTRLGGDEFAVLLPDVADLDAALLVAERIQRSLQTAFDVHGMSLAVEASIGVVLAPEHGDDAGTLLQRAEVAMYVAKDNGVQIAAYERSLDGHSKERAALLGDLRRALELGELVMHYQPQHDLSTGALRGVEALVRWQHPVHGLLSPERFLPLAERTGLVHELTRFVLDAALGDCRRWQDLGIEVPVAVNLSARTLVDASFASTVERVLDYWGVPARLLVLEITESALMADPERARSLLVDLSGLGVQISIDDFGTGYSSLTCLRTLPVDELKIDRSFVSGMLVASNDAFIVRSVVRLGHDLGLRVVAEGIEDEPTREALLDLGCDVGQGYALGRPVSADRLAVELVREGTAVPTPRPRSATGRPAHR